MRPQDRNEPATHRKLEAIEAELTRHRRRSSFILLLVVLLNAMILAVLVYHLQGHD